MPKKDVRVALLAGGVGGARMASGFYDLFGEAPGGRLDIIGNTGDDCTMWGLHICPDLDTLMYTLTGNINTAQGWGVAGDTVEGLALLRRYAAGQPDDDSWFTLGDKDLATHIRRSQLLHRGVGLTAVTEQLSRALGLAPFCRILPMTEYQVHTVVRTVEQGDLDFQDYFVRHRATPTVTAIRFEGVQGAFATDAALTALRDADTIVIGPSNPFLSIDPILSLPHIRNSIARDSTAARLQRRVAVSPIVGGAALKGPAARLLASLGHEVSALGVARLYAGLVDIFVLDRRDAALADAIAALGLRPLVTDTIMRDAATRTHLARTILDALDAA